MIQVKNLSKEFRIPKKHPGFKGALKTFFSNEYTAKKAVDDISFNIDKGEIVGYIGANGAGKSTTIKMMTGILVPTSGEVIVDGIVPFKNRIKNSKNIGVVFGQKTQLWWDLPVSETFFLLKHIYDISDNDYKHRMEFLNETLELEEFMLRPVRTLSLGQRMRADLAASLINNPKILYLDEPTIGLDVVVKENVRNAIKSINAEFGTTIILTTHDIPDIEELCNRIIVIDNGKKIYDGNLDNLKLKYGYMSSINLQIENPDININLNDEFNLSEENLTAALENKNLKVTFNKSKVSHVDILDFLIKKYKINDFSVSETGIEDIVKKLYRKGV